MYCTCGQYLSVEEKEIELEGLIVVRSKLSEADTLSQGIIGVLHKGRQLLTLGGLGKKDKNEIECFLITKKQIRLATVSHCGK